MKSFVSVLLALLGVAGAASADTFTCSGGAQVITFLENATEVSSTVTCPGFQFGASAGTAVFFEPDGITPSDILTLADVAGVATATFVSDLDLQLPLPTGGFISVTEPNPFVVLAASTSDDPSLSFTFTSDLSESLTTSDQLSIARVPEPAAVTLTGIALLGVCLCIRRSGQGPRENRG